MACTYEWHQKAQGFGGRYLINNKRREITIGQYPKMGLANAKVEAAKTQINIDNQIDPLAEKQRLAVREFNTGIPLPRTG